VAASLHMALSSLSSSVAHHGMQVHRSVSLHGAHTRKNERFERSIAVVRFALLHALHVVRSVTAPQQQFMHGIGYATMCAATCVVASSSRPHCSHRDAYVCRRRAAASCPVVPIACTKSVGPRIGLVVRRRPHSSAYICCFRVTVSDLRVSTTVPKTSTRKHLDHMDTDAYVHRMLQCAKWYRHSGPDGRALPSRFDDPGQAFEMMRDALLFEAHAAMQRALPHPERLVLNAVDLHTAEPGIVASRSGDMSVARGNDRVVPVPYTRRSSAAAPSRPTGETRAPPLTERARARTRETSKRGEQRALQTNERRAAREMMTPDERREQRKAKRRVREEAAASSVDTNAGEGGAADTTDAGEAGDDVEEDAARGGGDDAPTKTATRSSRRACEEDVESLPRPPPDAPKPKRKRSAKVEIFESPASHDRHLVALTRLDPHPSIAGTLLRGEPSRCPGVRIVQGPPGTGKTTALLQELAALLAEAEAPRCLVCAPSNVAVADLYRRALDAGITGALCLSKEHMPPGTPRRTFLQLVEARVVFATVCGRSGPRLADLAFDAVLLDEAAHCAEAHAWGLLRPEVRTLVMAGDVAQLPAQVSAAGEALAHARSMMQRLVEIGVEASRLTVQRRMHDEILSFPNRRYYEGALTTGERRTPTVAHALRPYEVVHVEGAESPVNTSFENAEEAAEVLREVEALRAAGLSEVAVLAPYQAQVRRLLAAGSGTPVLTVDAAQGKEYDGVVLCVVRTSAPGFWEDERRLTVALTRARHAMRVVLHGEAATSSLGGGVAALVDDARERGCLRGLG
jgi:DNA polymerase III delta prime subunit